jgi:hypothetical protein
MVFSWNGVDEKGIALLAILMTLMYVTIFIVSKNIPSTELQVEMNKYIHSCFLKCNSCDLSGYRDGEYSIEYGNELKKCMFTSWELSHLLFHALLGYYYNIYISFATSVGFEIYEHYVLNCGSILDIGHNFVGFMLGYCLRRYIKGKNVV